MDTIQQEVDERTNLTSSNKFELLLFRLGGDANGDRSELFGINVFKVREIVEMPVVTAIAGSPRHILGMTNLRGQVISVIDLPSVVGCNPKTGLNIMLVTEYARSTQAFAVESVEDIVRLEWSQVMSAEGNAGSTAMVTSIVRLDGNVDSTRLAQVLDVEQILHQITSTDIKEVDPNAAGLKLKLRPGTVILSADDSAVARALIEQAFKAMNVPYIMTKTGKQGWDRLQIMAAEAEAEGKTAYDKVALVLTDLEMPEMDGFTLTRNIKNDPRFKNIPVIIHSSLSGSANEEHVKTVGADAYVAKFVALDLANKIREVLARY
ncbi:chemotaxis protein [Herbaspirillum sp. RTI4]|uniref:chemotaxis protein n=1 Tax=Herbaspirillum sp. RTI4 TaxID=3048640 RepID=UPI002AB36C66|nr:chemotaxis protein [Herbaspirillum sp. RTI4]MDY7579611.1 chemotaxis protein [Herbaspirillum sp. RTI4]MEA9981760.1 chemotaxis protein [Herbaspirillum sp. RTI4]